MPEMTDIVIIGGAAAGISAALTAMHRGKSALIVSSRAEDSALWKRSMWTTTRAFTTRRGRSCSRADGARQGLGGPA